MKILKLRMNNINSLKGYNEIDFLEITKASSIFAIVGDTGAGKSTILDAICAGLYAKTPRLKNASELMSKHTFDCSVEVEFKTNNKIYVSYYGIKKGKKDSKKTKPAHMQLHEKNQNKYIFITSGVSIVPKKIEEISGLDFEKFCKSVLLAQGSFDKFLKSNNNEKTVLLENITGAGVYKQISILVHNEFTEKKSQIQSMKSKFDDIKILTQEELAALEIQRNNILLTNSSMQARLEEINVYKNNKKEFEKAIKEVDSYTLQLNNLKIKESENLEKFTKLHLHTKAKNLQPLYVEYNNLFIRLKQNSDSIEQNSKNITCAKEKLQEKEALYNRCSSQLTEFTKKHNKTIEKIKTARSLNVDIAKFDENINLSLKEIDGLKLQITDLNNKIIKNNENIFKGKNLDLQVRFLKKKIDKLMSEQSKLTLDLEKICTKFSQNSLDEGLLLENTLIEKIKSIDKFNENVEKIGYFQQNLKIYESQLTNINDRLQNLQSLLESAQKQKQSELLISKYEEDRKLLKPGCECFLCGSKIHPFIKCININPDLTKMKIDGYHLEINNTHISKNEILEKIVLLKSNISNLNAENNSFCCMASKDELIKQLSDVCAENKVLSNLKTQIQTIQNNLDNNQKIIQKNQDCLANLLQNIGNNLEINRLIDGYRHQIYSKQQQILILEDKLRVYNQELYHKFQILDSLNIDYKNLDRLENQTVSDLENLKKQNIKLESDISNLHTQIKLYLDLDHDLKQTTVYLQEQFNLAKTKYLNNLSNNQFNSTDEFLNSLLNEHDFQEISNDCNEILEAIKKTNTLLEESKSRLIFIEEKIENIDFDSLEQEYLQILDDKDKNMIQLGEIQNTINLNNQNNIQSKLVYSQLIQKEKEFENISLLNDLIGSYDGNKFSQIAQNITLDFLINIANNYLKMLSNRYKLQRGDKLNLNVLDLFQAGAIRSVNTLSGGESFIVSLSLALGLSSLASKNFKIDSLFLDEGFGTLDENSLEMALNALDKLQQNGKNIGIISHVSILQKRIPVQIRVIKGVGGNSKIDIVV